MNLSGYQGPGGADSPARKRVGRGMGSGLGKTSTPRSKRSDTSVSGYKPDAGVRRRPDAAAPPRFPSAASPTSSKSSTPMINLGRLDKMEGDTFSPDSLDGTRARIIKKLGDGAQESWAPGELTRKITVEAHLFSKSAKPKRSRRPAASVHGDRAGGLTPPPRRAFRGGEVGTLLSKFFEAIRERISHPGSPQAGAVHPGPAGGVSAWAATFPTPGVNLHPVGRVLQRGTRAAIFGFFDLFAGGNIRRLTIFALGIMPYITASIILQLLTVVIPTLEKLQKEGELGRRKITQWTRYLTVMACPSCSRSASPRAWMAMQGGIVIRPGLRASCC